MKFVIQRSKEETPWTVDIPNSALNNGLAIDEKIDLAVSRDGITFTTQTAMLLGDGRSLLVGHEIIRFSSGLRLGRNNTLRLGLGGIVTQQNIHCKVLKPVEPKRTAATLGGGDIKSPMTGKVLNVMVASDGLVQEGDVLLIIEAMKMENRILAECTGIVKNVKVEAGRSVSTGELLLTIVPAVSA